MNDLVINNNNSSSSYDFLTTIATKISTNTTAKQLFVTTSHNASYTEITMMTEFQRIWTTMFLSTLISSIIFHLIGSIVYFIRLRKHKHPVFLMGAIVCIMVAGFITPIVLGSINNALITSILVFSSRFDLPSYIVLLIGLCQTIVIVLVGFLKITQTL